MAGPSMTGNTGCTTLATLHDSDEAVAPEASGLNARPAAPYRLDHAVLKALDSMPTFMENEVLVSFLWHFYSASR